MYPGALHQGRHGGGHPECWHVRRRAFATLTLALPLTPTLLLPLTLPLILILTLTLTLPLTLSLLQAAEDSHSAARLSDVAAHSAYL